MSADKVRLYVEGADDGFQVTARGEACVYIALRLWEVAILVAKKWRGQHGCKTSHNGIAELDITQKSVRAT